MYIYKTTDFYYHNGIYIFANDAKVYSSKKALSFCLDNVYSRVETRKPQLVLYIY